MRGAQRKGNIYISLSQTGMLTDFQRHRLPCCFPTSFKSAVGQREKTGSWFLGRGAQWTELHPLGGRWGRGALLIPLLTSSLMAGVFQISTRPPCLDLLKRWRLRAAPILLCSLSPAPHGAADRTQALFHPSLLPCSRPFLGEQGREATDCKPRGSFFILSETFISSAQEAVFPCDLQAWNCA